MLSVFAVMVYMMQKCGKEEYQKDSLLLKNDFVLKGIVDDVFFSNNHCFSVIHLTDFTSNFKYFNPKKDNIYFPYAIEGKRAEVYTNVCSTQIDSGRFSNY